MSLTRSNYQLIAAVAGMLALATGSVVMSTDAANASNVGVNKRDENCRAEGIRTKTYTTYYTTSATSSFETGYETERVYETSNDYSEYSTSTSYETTTSSEYEYPTTITDYSYETISDSVSTVVGDIWAALKAKHPKAPEKAPLCD